MRGIKIPPQDCAKMQGGLMREGGVFAGHYSSCLLTFSKKFIFADGGLGNCWYA